MCCKGLSLDHILAGKIIKNCQVAFLQERVCVATIDKRIWKFGRTRGNNGGFE